MNKKKILTMGCLSVALCACCAFGIRYAVQADKQGVQESYPLIEVDYCGAEEIPYAIVGNSYKVFEAKAIGEKTSQSFNLTTKVYYNYYSDTPINVNLENGEFVPKN
ncbi:MAG: hypothetical protein IJF64_03420, partial [Clostridia bacterium]|nr:hypothetical protein [Clostridia bacterium]